MTITFTTPTADTAEALHHQRAAHGNNQAAAQASKALTDALDATAAYDKILLRAAAGAGKTHALRHMVQQALDHPSCSRVAVTAFANKQVIPLASDLGRELGADRVCLFIARDRWADIPPEIHDNVSVATGTADIPASCDVIVGTSHKLGAFGETKRLLQYLGPADNGSSPFDVLFVDEAWQLPAHRYATVEKLAPISVGVGDVGQLPPLEPGEQNPWRGDPGHNPYRAWPTAYPAGPTTRIVDLPAVWRPTATQLPLWRAFYTDWDQLHCVAAPGDRAVQLPPMTGTAASVWNAVADGNPTLLEIEGLPEPEAADIDLPLLGVLEQLLDPLLDGGFRTVTRSYNGQGAPASEVVVDSTAPHGDPLIVILATRNQAVDDATDLVERLTERYDLPEGVLVASTVDSWQGQTNAITIAIHPLSGAEQLDEFNSAFGRLAVTCTRATHGLLMIARHGLDDLLDTTPARPGTPLGEPGPRFLPRQTHQRILSAFAKGLLTVPPSV
ncbi:AAA family ATPase [Actinoplanes sp. NPDC048796]|uniref:AAA family ATPase n=1 Tax=Actinoplanes sp. NPDC048796 TaxID=3155640 RepID=UPI003410FD9A